MSNYKEKIIDSQTGEETWRDYTPEEITEVEKALAKAKIKEAEQAAKAEQRAALLERLGITEEEAKLLLGQVMRCRNSIKKSA